VGRTAATHEPRVCTIETTEESHADCDAVTTLISIPLHTDKDLILRTDLLHISIMATHHTIIVNRCTVDIVHLIAAVTQVTILPEVEHMVILKIERSQAVRLRSQTTTLKLAEAEVDQDRARNGLLMVVHRQAREQILSR
jgi:hypothetical protein